MEGRVDEFMSGNGTFTPLDRKGKQIERADYLSGGEAGNVSPKAARAITKQYDVKMNKTVKNAKKVVTRKYQGQ
jgi:hypothetical protein